MGNCTSSGGGGTARVGGGSPLTNREENGTIEERRRRREENQTSTTELGNTATQSGHLEGSLYNTAAGVEWIRQATGASPQTAKSYQQAVEGFSYQWDYEIRYYQKNGTFAASHHGHSDDSVKKKAEDLENYIKAAPKWAGGTTYRGVSLNDADLKAIKVGKPVNANNGGSASWSTNQYTAEGFSNGKNPNRVVFISPTQSKGTSIKHLSKFKGENEVLTSKDSQYIVKKKYKKSNVTYVEVVEG